MKLHPQRHERQEKPISGGESGRDYSGTRLGKKEQFRRGSIDLWWVMLKKRPGIWQNPQPQQIAKQNGGVKS
jgi:hypothetical protein